MWIEIESFYSIQFTSIRYGVLVSDWFDAEVLSAFGGPIGELSSNISPDTRNFIDSPISIYKSCVAPSSNGYSQTHACSASSKRDGCCKPVDGIKISSKKPNVTAHTQQHSYCINLLRYVTKINVNAYHEHLLDYNFEFCQ